MAFTLDMAVVMGISAAALYLFIRETITPDVVALVVVLAVILTGVTTPTKALSGFASPAVHTLAAMFVISAGLIRTGAVEKFTRYILKLGGNSPTRILLVMLVTVIVLSAFVNNTPIVVMMIPVSIGVWRAHGIKPSKLLIPVSYASILGGCCTLIGTSTNLVVSGMAEDRGLAPISMFELTSLGVILAVIGLVYLTLFARRLLPDRETVTALVREGRVKEYVTELVIRPESPLIGRRLPETTLTEGGLKIVEVIRGDEIHWPPFAGVALREADILFVRGSAEEILKAGLRSGVDIIPELGPESVRIDAVTPTLAEAVVAPGSRFQGATLGEIGFRQHFGVSVIAIQRHGRHHLREKVGRSRLQVGDVLVVTGDAPAVERLRDEEGIILLEALETTVLHEHRAPIAVGILLAVVLAATFSGLPVVGCALTGALLMVLTRCLSVRQLYRSVDVRTLVLIAGMLGLGRAAEDTNAARWVAQHLLSVVEPLGAYAVLMTIYLLTNLVTEFLSNAAAAVLMVPLAIPTAQALGLSERPFLVAVAFAASAAFSTPVGYQTNTIVYGPGGYRFTDYPKVGLPLNLLFLVIATLLIPVFWPFVPG